ncbi:hypothetical protein SERLADRAFT_447764 [Serpula lacrymans var. lacrymans S7.9]|uniref:NB-ARC domain-containing protein n=1 Tax=Serpula lacrymans var. lacrymans (strain S7.9) TaxID=578457 RepID=F8NQK0_SERL9|nr:uncharacterized protein SERLADRAFT_447764 [Serpula lacrymans var. lacrymans S7.9]EGO26606.1 hypothetical protein SERLADRAFT_447764 [Serpula lacrymans var. lacrymans S7.9]
MSNPGFFYGAQHTNITGSQMNDVGHDQYNTTITNIKNLSLTVPQQENVPVLSFNDAPVDLLSIHFAGRDQELHTIKQLFGSIQDDVPSRCAIYGMPGIGKTQLTLQYAKLSYQQKQYTYVFWISGATVEKLNQGFVKLLNLVSHPERNNPEQDARLVAARRWLEDCSATSWLVVFDNVSRDTLSFLREHVPRKNVRGNILYTTRTEDVAKAVVNAAGQQQHILELRVLDIKDAASLFFQNAEIDEEDTSSSSGDCLSQLFTRLLL